MADREQAIQLAKRDTPAALACAREIVRPWYRSQSLGWVARFAPEADLIPIATEALQAAEAGLDDYQKVVVTAWPIRALIERGALAAAESAIQSVLPRADDIEHPGARAEALIHLLQAALPAPQTTWRPVVHALFETPQTPMHWRLRRALRDAIRMIRAGNPELAIACRGRIQDGKTLRQVDRDADQDSPPRAFFW